MIGKHMYLGFEDLRFVYPVCEVILRTKPINVIDIELPVIALLVTIIHMLAIAILLIHMKVDVTCRSIPGELQIQGRCTGSVVHADDIARNPKVAC